MELEVGKAYFDISWSTAETKVPDIETYIFIGKNIYGEADEYYFQTPYSYEKHGDFSVNKNKNIKAEAEIILLPPDLVEVLFTLEGVIEHLQSLKAEHSNLFGIIKI